MYCACFRHRDGSLQFALSVCHDQYMLIAFRCPFQRMHRFHRDIVKRASGLDEFLLMIVLMLGSFSFAHDRHVFTWMFESPSIKVQ